MACYHPSAINVERRQMAGFPPRLDEVTVPCGTCIGCRSDQGRDWAIRLMHEAQTQSELSAQEPVYDRSAYFVTLTYSDEHIPGNWPDDERKMGSLDADDLQLFLKRLRRKSTRKLGYYACGEYGSRNGRPHYHLALFGMRFLDKDQIGVRKGYPVFQSESLERTWGMGSTELTQVTFKSASYVSGYVRKKARQKAEPTHHIRVNPDTGELVELEPEFSRMSRRPGLGRRFIEKYYRDVYPRDFVVVDGSPLKPPRFYDKVMEEIDPELMEEVRYQRWKDAEEIGDEKLIMMEKVHRARLKLFNKRDRL